MSCSSSGTTIPGSRKLASKRWTSWVAASTSSCRARYHGPAGVRTTGHFARSCSRSGESPGALSGSKVVMRASLYAETRLRAWCGRDELDGDAVGIAQLERRLAELERDTRVLDADLGQMIGPQPQRVSVGHREREVIERFCRAVAAARLAACAQHDHHLARTGLERDVRTVVG